jgi:hypothetical protein
MLLVKWNASKNKEMKRIAIYITLVILAGTHAFAATEQQLADSLQHANKLAMDGQNAEAINTYNYILGEGYESAELYYNLGYCHYKSGKLGPAILNFERAKRLNPSDEDTQYNLEQAYEMTDKMQKLTPIFIFRWWDSFRNITNSDGWAVIFIVFFVLVLAGVAMFLFANSVAMRKVGFFAGLILTVLAIGALTISINQRNEVVNSKAAIIMSSSVTLSTSPDKNGTQMVVLHEGTHVVILSTIGDWSEVRLDDGNVGWIKSQDIEVI